MTHGSSSAGQRALLMLPINEMPLHESSPYSALSAMAIDPQFITLDLVEDFAAIGGEASLEPEWRTRLDAVRSSRAIDYVSVRELKHLALRRSFERFQQTDWKGDSQRAARFRAYTEEQAWWLDDYALFRALHAHSRRAALDGVAGTHPRTGIPRPWSARGSSWTRTFGTASTCSGLPASNGRPRGRARGASPSSAISRLS